MSVIRARSPGAVRGLLWVLVLACSGRNPAYREPPAALEPDAGSGESPDLAPPVEAPGGAPDADTLPDVAAHADAAALPDAVVAVDVAAPDVGADVTPPPDLAPDKPPPGEVLLVVGTVPVEDSDIQLRDSLVKLKFKVTPKDGDETVVGDAAGKMLIVISGSAWSDEVKGRFREVAVPVVVFDNALFAPMSMTDDSEGTHYGSVDTRRLEILPERHPLAAGLIGEVIVADSTFMMSWGVPGPSATVVAAIIGQPNRFPIFAYEKGAPMFDDFIAPERRVGSFVRFPDESRYTAAGLQLFEASVLWAAHYSD
jgi:hypothetical protein